MSQQIVEHIKEQIIFNLDQLIKLKTKQEAATTQHPLIIEGLNVDNGANNKTLVQIIINYLPKAIAQLKDCQKSGHQSTLGMTIDELEHLLQQLKLSFQGVVSG